MIAPLCRHGHGPKVRYNDRRERKGWSWYCRVCNRGYRRITDANRRDRIRVLVLEEVQKRGGRCSWPGCTWMYEDGVLQWHHRDPETKRFEIGHATSINSVARVEAELAKCDLFCANHHIIADAI